MTLLSIQDLHVDVPDASTAMTKSILKGIDLDIRPGEVHAIMGPNGSGKSTLAHVLAGHPGYAVTRGDILYQGISLLDKAPDVRAREGLFLAFQYPVEIPGVSNIHFLKTALNAKRKHQGLSELDAMDFLTTVKDKVKKMGMKEALLYRALNEGFSGGEKKRNEVLQMAVLEPQLAILDEIDSGLDIDALQMVAQGVNALRDGKRSFLMITHYQRLLNYIVPDVIHVMAQGRIVKTGGAELALTLEEEGYAWIS